MTRVTGLPVLGINARDPERLLAFYRDFLGWPVVRQMDLREHGVRLWFLAMGDAELKLITDDEPPAAANPPGGVHGATGFRYFTLPIEGLDAVLAGLTAAGGREVRPVIEIGGVRNAMIEDPEGNCFELTEPLG